jgi:hypothetical protein
LSSSTSERKKGVERFVGGGYARAFARAFVRTPVDADEGLPFMVARGDEVHIHDPRRVILAEQRGVV